MAIVKGFRLGDGREILSPKVVITMPAYNAEATLARTVADIPVGIADQLILVDDASPDNTAQLARDLGVDVHVHPENRGYGGNQKTCYTMALRGDADIVVMLHPDYQYEPKAVPLLIAPILAGDADMTFGSRFAGLSDPRGGGMPVQRYIGNRVTTILENLMLGSRFSEMHSGMRAYTRRCLLSLPFLRYSDDFIFDSQLLIDAVTTGQRVVEVPIPTRYTHESSSIGTLRSLTYVTGSVGYCAARVLAHGRKTHRSPIGRHDAGGLRATAGGPAGERLCVLCGVPQLHLARSRGALLECAGCGLISLSQRPAPAPGAGDIATGDSSFLEWILAAIRGYVVRGNRLLVVGAPNPPLRDAAVAAGWDPVDAESLSSASDAGLGHVDAVVILAMAEELLDTLEGLPGLRSLLEPEGLLALVGPSVPRRQARWPFPHYLQAATLDGALRGAGFRLVEWAHLPRADACDYGRWLTSRKHRAVQLDRPDVALAVARPAGLGSRAS